MNRKSHSRAAEFLETCAESEQKYFDTIKFERFLQLSVSGYLFVIPFQVTTPQTTSDLILSHNTKK